MPTSQVPAIKYALRFVASSPEYTDLKHEIATLSKTRHGGFTGNASCLNVLVEWARDSGPDSLKEFWRISDPEHARLFPAARKTQYQGSYMQQRRERLRKALELHEQLEQRKLRGSERDNWKRDMQALWMYHRDECVHQHRPGSKRNEAVKAYWAKIDALLDKGLAGDTQSARKALGEDQQAWLQEFHSGLTQP